MFTIHVSFYVRIDESTYVPILFHSPFHFTIPFSAGFYSNKPAYQKIVSTHFSKSSFSFSLSFSVGKTSMVSRVSVKLLPMKMNFLVFSTTILEKFLFHHQNIKSKLPTLKIPNVIHYFSSNAYRYWQKQRTDWFMNKI